MPRGFLSHVDFSVGNPARAIPFYDTLLTALGYQRYRPDDPAWQEPAPTRAAWSLAYPDGTRFGIDLRPASHEPTRPYDRFEPGPHHIAFQVEADAEVDRVHDAMCAAGAAVLDAPAQYGGTPAYGDHYYAAFYSDPDGFKVEVVHAIELEA